MDAPERMLTVKEVAALFRVNEKTVRRWAKTGRFGIRTPGGRYRFPESVILAQTETLQQTIASGDEED